MERIYELLWTSEESRSRIEVSKLYLHLKENQFFKNLVEKKPLDQVLDLINKLKYEFKQENEFVFHYGD